jgi:tetratricopeptide (TPR) repeat protein
MARLLAEQHEWDAALDACDAGLSLDPHNGDLQVMWAGLVAQGDASLAETLLVAAVEGSPGSLPVYRALFAYYVQAGQIAQAARWAESALAAVPGSAWPQIMLGRVALAKENPAQAIVRFRRARMMRPDLADPLIGTSEAYLLQSNVAAAIVQAGLAVQVEPYRADAYSALGDAQRAAHDIPAARQAYRQALALDAGNEEIASALASLSE